MLELKQKPTETDCGCSTPAKPVEKPAPDLSSAELAEFARYVDRYLRAGCQLKRWFDRTEEARAFAKRFDLGRTYNRPEDGYGFFDRADIDGKPVPIMGNLQQMAYDHVKAPPGREAAGAAWMQEQIREFVLRYFMRVSSFRDPEVLVDSAKGPQRPTVGVLSWCHQETVTRQGFGFEQLYYKSRTDGSIGTFSPEERPAIVDLREIGKKYEWIVVRVNIFDFTLAVKPFGGDAPQVVVPLQEESLLVLSSDFIEDSTRPSPGVLGRYGLGYAFIKNTKSTPLGYGPGEFDQAMQTIQFTVSADGRVQVRMVFVANRPSRVLNVSVNPATLAIGIADRLSFGMASRLLQPFLRAARDFSAGIDPVFAYIDAVNIATGGAAAKRYCISREELERGFLAQHFRQHYRTLLGSLQTWRQTPDWFDPPEWARTGRSS